MRVSILTSGIGLGIYIPSLLIQRELASRGIAAEVEVLEGYYTEDHQRRHLAHRQAYHQNFDLAVMAHRMARSVESSLDPGAVDALLRGWQAARRTHFIVWSGFWLPILERYRRDAGAPLHIDCCRIDAVVSASFRVHAGLAPDATEIWLWNAQDRRTVFEIPVTHQPPLAFSDRDHRLVVHGGGWGLGTYRASAAELAATGWACDVVVHARDEAAAMRGDDRYFMVDPDWRTWHRGPEGHTFPPLAAIDAAIGAAIDAAPARANDHALYELIRRGKAIVSKPGGGTLIDSLSAATPVVLLEPYGDAEASNGEVWQHLGFGIPYAVWRASGYDEAVLQQLHDNLVRRVRGPAYVADYVARSSP